MWLSILHQCQKKYLEEKDRFTTNTQNYILYPTVPPKRISSSETLPMSSRINDGSADSKTASDIEVLTAMHLQTMKQIM